MWRTVPITALCAGLALAACEQKEATGADLYADLCAGCHGAGGKGDGPGADLQAVKPADLTRIASRNGGEYPRVAVMAKVHGYARGEDHYGAMPAFWPLLEGPKVLVDTGDGVMTPTPEPLVRLADYLETLQQ